MSGYDVSVLQDQWGELFHFYEEIGSTNAEALQMAREGAPEGSLILAEKQTQGRGRRGASWFCGEGAGLAFSLLLRPKCERVFWPRLALVAGLAVSRALERAGVSPEIKWPNDVLVAGKKVCGILVEAEGDAVVVGVGLNVRTMEMPSAIQQVTTSLEAERAQTLAREYYLNEVVSSLREWGDRLDEGFSDLLESIRSRCALRGEEIRFLVGQEAHQGLCLGIDEGGELLVRSEGMVRRHVAAEQIRILER